MQERNVSSSEDRFSALFKIPSLLAAQNSFLFCSPPVAEESSKRAASKRGVRKRDGFTSVDFLLSYSWRSWTLVSTPASWDHLAGEGNQRLSSRRCRKRKEQRRAPRRETISFPPGGSGPEILPLVALLYSRSLVSYQRLQRSQFPERIPGHYLSFEFLSAGNKERNAGISSALRILERLVLRNPGSFGTFQLWNAQQNRDSFHMLEIVSERRN